MDIICVASRFFSNISRTADQLWLLLLLNIQYGRMVGMLRCNSRCFNTIGRRWLYAFCPLGDQEQTSRELLRRRSVACSTIHQERRTNRTWLHRTSSLFTAFRCRCCAAIMMGKGLVDVLSTAAMSNELDTV